jgi:restriction system protein
VAIPDFQTLMRPLLELHADGGEKTQDELRRALAEHFALTSEELEQRLPSGTARTFVNRAGWASSYMTQAGLLAKPRRAVSVITERGRSVLSSYPDRIDMAVLEQFPEYVDFRSGSSDRRARQGRLTQPVQPEGGTPNEVIEDAYEQVRSAVAEELLGRLVVGSEAFFEDAVLDVLLGLGYGGSRREAAERVGRSGDGGIDGVIREDQLGLDAIYVQAKKWARERGVAPREIREFLGALQDVEAAKRVFITTSSFSPEARELARRRRVVLIDGLELAQLMIDAGGRGDYRQHVRVEEARRGLLH